MNVLIADDERIVLNGLKYIIDWGSLGFSICDTSMDGAEALDKILALKPDLVLLDIRMPKLSGIEVVQQAVARGFTGKFIILSGVSDFKLAQTAMRHGVNFYLTKPIDEDELEQAVHSVAELISQETKKQSSYSQYRTKAKQEILKDLLQNTCDYYSLDLDDLHLNANVYQVVAYENYNQDYFHTTWNFADLIRVTNQDNNSFDIIELDQQNVVLLKGDYAISKFMNMLRHYRVAPQKGSPLDSIFLIYGQKVSRIRDIHHSYHDVYELTKRRFFCQENQHIVGYEELIAAENILDDIKNTMAEDYAEQFSNYIQSNNHTLITVLLKQLTAELTCTSSNIPAIKHVLIDIYILVKQKIMQIYRNVDIPFMANASVIDLLDRKYYLYEIITFLAEQFDLWTHSVGYSSGENVLDEVLYYIKNNYQENIKLESIAPLFGYNSSYLGKIFSKKLGVNFNSYVDQIRIDEAKKLLKLDDLKVYTIAEQIGYKNVDYFHKKFKKYVGMSPLEYRKTFHGEFE
ncbi:response regulator transcription factor [Konateibacter massiliensis]|uniref:response regulator transcription factor n=1 Tax=Konateibacter massiliensis TaxID=2002841 RepID=UPI000C161863|nr:response regulator [Konateibacter massiliensis]